MVVRDLRVYTQAADAGMFHCREKSGLEVDAIVQCNDGRWAAFEVTLGERRVDRGERDSVGGAGAVRGVRDVPWHIVRCS